MEGLDLTPKFISVPTIPIFMGKVNRKNNGIKENTEIKRHNSKVYSEYKENNKVSKLDIIIEVTNKVNEIVKKDITRIIESNNRNSHKEREISKRNIFTKEEINSVIESMLNITKASFQLKYSVRIDNFGTFLHRFPRERIREIGNILDLYVEANDELGYYYALIEARKEIDAWYKEKKEEKFTIEREQVLKGVLAEQVTKKLDKFFKKYSVLTYEYDLLRPNRNNKDNEVDTNVDINEEL